MRYERTLHLATAMWITTCLVPLAGCDDDPPARNTKTDGAVDMDGGVADAAYTCTPPSDCRDLTIADSSTKACCSPMVRCGYELPMLDETNKMYFPQAEDYIANLTKDDPNGRCAPESFFFGPGPGLYEHRVAVDGGVDILITPDCAQYHLLAFTLGGCCLPDDTCGLSTDGNWPTLEYLAQDPDALFNHPECVSAEELNRQFRESVTLEGFARTTATGSCDRAAIDMRLPE